MQRSAQAVAQIDVLCSLADVACDQNYICPIVDFSDKIEIHGRPSSGCRKNAQGQHVHPE